MTRVLVNLALLLIATCRCNWVEMPQEYLKELTLLAQTFLADKIESAHQSLMEQRLHLEIEQKNAEIWKANVQELNVKILQHLASYKLNFTTCSKNKFRCNASVKCRSRSF